MSQLQALRTVATLHRAANDAGINAALGGKQDTAAEASSCIPGCGSPTSFLGLGMCRACEDEVPEDVSEDAEQGAERHVAGAAHQVEEFCLRLLVYEGDGLPVDDTFVTVALTAGGQEQWKEASNPLESKRTSNPQWRFEVEKDLTIVGQELVDIFVYGKRMLGNPVVLGHTQLSLDSEERDVQYKVRALSGADEQWNCGGGGKLGKITVVYHLTPRPMHGRPPDLVSIAEFGPKVVEKGDWTLQAKVLAIGTKPKHGRSNRVYAKIRLLRPALMDKDDEDLAFQPRLSPATQVTRKQGETGPGVVSCFEDKEDREDKEGGGETGWVCDKIKLHDSLSSLMGYVLQVSIWATEQTQRDVLVQSPKDRRLGAWREGLFELHEAMEQQGCFLRFDAVCLADQDGEADVNVGLIRLELDLYKRHPHENPGPCPPVRASFWDAMVAAESRHFNTVNANEQIPLNLGMPKENQWGQEVVYYITVAADGLVLPEGAEACSPYVKITLGGRSQKSLPRERRANDVEWPEVLPIRAKVIERTVKVQIFNNDLPGRRGEGHALICQATVHAVRPGVEYWLHCFGGAIGAPNQDMAEKMTAGLCKHASTYRGTVTLMFARTKRATQQTFKAWRQRRTPEQLTVCLHQGCFFTRFAGKVVTLLVQIPGCRLPDHMCTREEQNNPRRFNRNVLQVTGKVDEHGALKFGEGDKAYCERQTPGEMPLFMPPNALHAYVYLVAAGEETQPPKIWGILPLVREDQKVAWHRMRYDPSVIDLPQSAMENDCAGYILGIARIRPLDLPPDEQPSITKCATNFAQKVDVHMLPAETSYCCGAYTRTSKASPGIDLPVPNALPTRKLFVHLDIVLGRNLPADSNGCCAPVWVISVLNRVFRLERPRNHTANPLFMNRVVIPVEVEDDGLAFPPILVTLVNMSSSFLGPFSSHPQIGSIVIEAGSLLTAADANESGRLDLGRLHKARWYALDASQWSEFDPSHRGGVDASWLLRPRLLIAAAYAEVAETVGCQLPSPLPPMGHLTSIAAREYRTFQVEVSLLGLRNLPPGRLKSQLVVTSFWEDPPDVGPVSFDWQSGELNPNFGPCEIEPTELKHFQGKFANLFKLHDDILGPASPPLDEDNKPSVFASSLVGERIMAPRYKVPIIAYLQDAKHDPGSEPYVILPNITFHLRHAYTDYEWASASATLNQLRLLGGGPFERDWPEVCADELNGEAPPVGHDLCDNAYELDALYDISLDVFACQSGFLRFKKDISVGRMVSSTHLFTISDTMKEDSPGVTQTFNPWDDMVGDSRLDAEPFDSRVVPFFTCGDRSDPKHRMPIKPEDLFKVTLHGRFTTKDGVVYKSAAEFLRCSSTSNLHRNMIQHGWRSMTHLAAPEPECLDQHVRIVPNTVREHLKQNLHTFMRPVGHTILSGDRDSTLLARLRMARRDQDYDEFDNKNRNFLTFRIKLPGVVIWTAPDNVCQFCEPGQPIMAVELSDGSGDVVIIRIPSFDLRFPFEQIWWCRKTLRCRYHTVMKLIKLSQTKPFRTQVDNSHSVALALVGHPDDTHPGESAKDVMDFIKLAMTDMSFPDGHSRPIWVYENGFVMRCRLAIGSKKFARSCTKRWYSEVLRSTFPEIKQKVARGETESEIRDFLNARHMNIHLPLNVYDDGGLLQSQVAVKPCIKGHVRCWQVSDPVPTGQFSLDSAYEGEQQVKRGVVPIDRLWKKESMLLRVCALTAHDLRPEPTGTLYLIARLGGKSYTSDKVEVLLNMGSRTTYCLYMNFKIPLELPGPATLLLEVWHQDGVMNGKMLGVAEMDIEDRWLVLESRRLRSISEKEYRNNTCWPKQPKAYKRRIEINEDGGFPDEDAIVSSKLVSTTHKHHFHLGFLHNHEHHEAGNQPAAPAPVAAKTVWMDPMLPVEVPIDSVDNDDSSVRVFPPMRPPCEPLPIEVIDVIGGEAGFRDKVGHLRTMISLDPVVDNPRNLADPFMLSEYEIRVRIYHVDNIQVFRDNERNDLYVAGHFHCKDLHGKSYFHFKRTDTHKFAVTNASFNYEWVFVVKAPVVSAYLTLTLMDEDLISGDDRVYSPQRVDLDQLIHMAREQATRGKHRLGRLRKHAVFNKWEGMDKKDSCCMICKRCCCPCMFAKKLPKEQMYARLEMTIEVIPTDDEDYAQADDGQFAKPTDRLTLQSAATDPIHTMNLLIGETRSKRTRCLCLCMVPLTCCLAFALLCVLLLFYTGEIRSAWRGDLEAARNQ